MVVLSVALLTKPGKVLVARQFLSISRIRIEGLLAAFPKLIGTGDSHTFIETDAVRYVYQPLDQLYLVLITNKQSNIIEDLDTLRLFTKLIPDYCQQNTEDAVMKNVFPLIFAFDEVVSLGSKENVTLAAIKTNLAMDSHEEKLQKIIMESKMTEAREESRRKAELIEKQKADMRNKMQNEGRVVGFGSSNYPGGGVSSNDYPQSSQSQSHGHGYQSPHSGTSSGGSGGSGAASAAAQTPKAEAKKAGPPTKGMSLGKAKTTDAFVVALQKEEGTARVSASAQRLQAANASAAAHKAAEQARLAKAANRLQVVIEEKLAVVLDKEGGVKKLEVLGGIRVVVLDPDESKIIINTSGAPNNSAIKFKLHPTFDTRQFDTTGVLVNKDRTKAYPVGTENASVVCKWRLQSTDEADVPIHVNFWDQVNQNRSTAIADFKTSGQNPAVGRVQPFTLRDVHIVIPCKSQTAPEIESDQGHVAFDNKEKVLMWSLETVGPVLLGRDWIGPTGYLNILGEELWQLVGEYILAGGWLPADGKLEFSIPTVASESFFPINVVFTSNQTYSGIQVLSVVDAESGAAIEYSASSSLTVEKFVIE